MHPNNESLFLSKWVYEDSVIFKLMGRRGLFSVLLRILEPRIRILFSFLEKLDENSIVLDFGCGTGRFSIALEKELGVKVIGIDVSSNAIEKANRLKDDYQSKVTFLQGDGRNLPFSDGMFDAIFSSDVLGHLSKPEEGINEMYRVLKKDGIASIYTETNGYLRNPLTYRYYICRKLEKDPWVEADLHIGLRSERELRKLFNNAGFKILSVKYDPFGHFLFSFISPRSEGALCEKYPVLRECFIVKTTELLSKIYAFANRLLFLKIISYILRNIIGMIMMKLFRRDCGGIYFKLVKI